MSTPPDNQSSLILPVGEKITHRSELFDVVILGKETRIGITRDTNVLHIRLLENDPLIQREAWIMVPTDVFDSVEKGERVQARLYEQANGNWTINPPTTG